MNAAVEYNTCLAELPDGIYYPFKRLPESKLEIYAIACVETALKYSENARIIYTAIVFSWDLPGCRELINEFKRCKVETKIWLRDQAKAVARNEPQPDPPDIWKDIITKFKDLTDVPKLLKVIRGFILIAFNRGADLENETPKIIPVKSPYLVRAIFFSSLLDYLNLRSELKGPGVISDTELTEFHWFCRTLASNPTTRISRQIRRYIVRTLRESDFTLHHYQTIFDGAEMWYRARVLCDTSRKAADYYRIDAIDLSKRIEPYDDAAGWPRHK